MIRVGIMGASGYTGVELIRLLGHHPHVQISALTAQRFAGCKVAEVFPSLAGTLPSRNSTFLELNAEQVLAECDFVFTALPHGASYQIIPGILANGKKVVDLSADFRLKDSASYHYWYKMDHGRPDLLKEAVYGLTEIHRAEVRSAELVANPGCYPTSIILALAPLLRERIIDTGTIIADSKSGVSGAGRKGELAYSFSEIAEGIKAYGLPVHRHTPEIEQELSLLAGEKITINFTPHLIPINRGILSTVYACLKELQTFERLSELYHDFYANEQFVTVAQKGYYPTTNEVKGSNNCHIGLVIDERTNRVILISVLDNLVKGASGQAIQNMNVMLGLDETMGLRGAGLYP